MRGFGAVNRSVEKAKERSSSSGGDNKPIQIFNWKDDGTKRTIRFLDDMPYVVGFHNWILCKDSKRRGFICPESLDESEGFNKVECPICAHVTKKNKDGEEIPERPTEQTIGWGVDRNVKGIGKDQVITDVLHEVDGKKVPWVGLIKQSNSNFWQGIMAIYSRYDTVVDRDIEIIRSGLRLDTKYQAMPWDQVEELNSQEKVDEAYEEAKSLVMSPAEYIKAFSSLSWINKNVLFPNGVGSSDEEEKENPAVPYNSFDVPDTSGNSSSDQDAKPEFQSLAERLRGHSSE